MDPSRFLDLDTSKRFTTSPAPQLHWWPAVMCRKSLAEIIFPECYKKNAFYACFYKSIVIWICFWNYLSAFSIQVLSSLLGWFISMHMRQSSEVAVKWVVCWKNLNLKVLIHYLATLPAPCISETCTNIKINLNFYFHTFLWCFKRFYEWILNAVGRLWEFFLSKNSGKVEWLFLNIFSFDFGLHGVIWFLARV